MPGDWIKCYRKMLYHPVMQHDGMCRLWMYCLLRANWQPKTVLLQGTMQHVELKRGQFITGRNRLHQDLYPDVDRDGNAIKRDAKAPHPMTLWRWLESLEEAGQVKIDSGAQGYSVVTICKYDSYQTDVESDAQPARKVRARCAQGARKVRAQNKKERRKEEGVGAPASSPAGPTPTPTQIHEQHFLDRYYGPTLKPGETFHWMEQAQLAGIGDADLEAEIRRHGRKLQEPPRLMVERLIAAKSRTNDVDDRRSHILKIRRQDIEERKRIQLERNSS